MFKEEQLQRVERETRERGLIGNFYRMSPEKENAFRQEVEKANGEINIFMHPYYNLHNTAEFIPLDDLKRAKSVNDAVQKTLETEGPPALIMEEALNIEKMAARLKPLHISRAAALAATRDGLPNPSIINDLQEQHKFSSSSRVLQEEWWQFLQKLKDLGVKKAEINGSFLWANGKPGAGEMDTGCVGGIIKELAEAGIKVKLGETNPDSREDIIRAGNSPFQKYL